MDAHSDAAMSIDAAAPAVNGTKKRKHAGAAEGSQSAGKPGPSSLASFAVSDDNVKDALRPLMASLPALALPAETRLSLFTEGGIAAPSKDKGKGKGRASSMLHGESEKLDWHSSNRLFGIQDGGNLGQLDDVYGAAGNDDGECSAAYALALYDPASSTISLVSTPLHIMQHMPKRLRTLSTLAALSEPATSNLAARTALGQEFGTKKAKRAIQAAERNKVDAGAKDLQLVQDVLMENLDAGLTTLPASSPVKGMGPGVSSSVDITALVEMAKKTGMPVPDTTALKAESVYHIFGEIILDKEWEAINPSPVLKTPASDVSQALSRLPFYHSTWINDRVRHLLSPQMADLDKKERSRRLGALLWLSGILAVKSHRGRVDVSSDEQMQKQFRRHSATVTPECMRSLFERFCENIRGTSHYQNTSVSESRLIAHFLVVALYLDDYTNLDIITISKDLSIPAKRASEFLHALGARLLTPKAVDLAKITAAWQNNGYTVPTGSVKLKVATLKIPLDFPRERRGKAPAKR